jgi:hypothetical protein
MARFARVGVYRFLTEFASEAGFGNAVVRDLLLTGRI